MHRLERHVLTRELGGKPVEECGICGRFPVASEITGRADDAAAEVIVPDPIDDHACSQRVVFGCDPVSEGQPSLCVGGLVITKIRHKGLDA